MKLWVDDYRDAPDDTWHTARNVTQAISALYHFSTEFKEISLDHDIEHSVETFLPVAMYIGLIKNNAVYHIWGLKWKPKITIHSINPVGSKEIQNVLAEYGLKSVRVPYDLEGFNKKWGLDCKE